MEEPERRKGERKKRVFGDNTVKHLERLRKQARALSGEVNFKQEDLSLEYTRVRPSNILRKHEHLRENITRGVADSTYATQSSAKECFSFTPESSMKKDIVLDEDDEKRKRQYEARRIPARYLQRPEFLCTEHKNDYHFFNTFFYSKLEEVLDSKCKQEDGNSFAKLRRWFKGVNIFEKAYIFLPIHACQHWSLAIISIPAREYESGPMILHLDSLGVHPSRTIFQNIRSYLKAEWEHFNQADGPVQVPIAEKIWKDLPCNIQEKQIQRPDQ